MNRQVSLCILALCAVGLCWSFELLPHLKEINDNVGFRIRYLPHSALPDDLISAPEDQVLSVVSADNEKYLCSIPEVQPSAKTTKISSYTGPSPGDLIAQLYTDQCSYRSDGYWTYEICPGRYLRQFHEEKTGEVSLEYYMGHYRNEEVAKEARAFDELNPPTKRIDGKDIAYYPVVYRQGSVCDISGTPRVATMNYVCWPNADEFVHSVRETTSCVYEIFVYTKRLCSHPAFPPPVATEHDIDCYAESDQQNVRPQGDLKMQDDLKKGFNSDYKIGTAPNPSTDDDTDDEDPTSFKVRVLNTEDLSDEEHDNLLQMLDTISGMTELESYVSELKDRLNAKKAKKAAKSTQASSMSNILLSECLIGGGSSYWKYELCYGKTVTHFHQDSNGRRTEIVLGYFDENLHKAFITQNPDKRPVVNERNEVVEVTHIYAGGEICGESKAHRSVEVHFRCRPVIGNREVSVFFDEPNTCQYVLKVDSMSFCSEMQTADAYGLMSIDKPKVTVPEDNDSAHTVDSTWGQSKAKKEVIDVIPGPAATKKDERYKSDAAGDTGRIPEPEL